MELSDTQFKADVYDYDTGELRLERPAVVELFTDWCNVCKIFSPALDSLAQKFKDKVDVMKVNITRSDALTQALDIQGVPTFLFLKPDTKTHTIIGATSVNAVEKAITEYLL